MRYADNLGRWDFQSKSSLIAITIHEKIIVQVLLCLGHCAREPGGCSEQNRQGPSSQISKCGGLGDYGKERVSYQKAYLSGRDER